MVVLVNGSPVVVSKGLSIEYVSESRDFSSSEDYTLSISFPLNGCKQNRAVFGDVDLLSSDISELRYDCKIIDGSFQKCGTLSLIKVSDGKVDCQFMVGRSTFNYSVDLSERLISQLPIGGVEVNEEVAIDKAVMLPWVNEQSGNILNKPTSFNPGSQSSIPGSGAYRPHPSAESAYANHMPYLLYIAKRVCECIGLEYDFSQWENSYYKYVLVCNSVPGIWGIQSFEKILPHWSVKEFFDELSKFLGGYFDFDLYKGKITFKFNSISDKEVIRIDRVLDNFTCSIMEKSVSDYVGECMLSFADRGDDSWKLESCAWAMSDMIIEEFDTLQNLLSNLEPRFHHFTNDGRPASWGNPQGIGNLFYAEDIDTYFAVKKLSSSAVSGGVRYTCGLVPINQFGPRNYVADSDAEVKKEEVKIIPVRIDFTDEENQFCIFLNPNSYSEDYDSDESIIQSPSIRHIMRGEGGEYPEYYSKIFVAFWDGNSSQNKGVPCPWVDKIKINENWVPEFSQFSMRLNDSSIERIAIDTKKKYELSFLANEFFDVNSIFYIKSNYYVCAKLKGTLLDEGLSKKYSGEFYRIKGFHHS